MEAIDYKIIASFLFLQEIFSVLGHQHQSTHQAGQSRNLAFAFFVNLVFTIIEIIGGIMTNSVAIQSDALHDLGDSLSLGIAWYFQKLSGRGATSSFTFGYKRFNTLGALITGIVLAAGSVYILMETIPRFSEPQETDALGMLGLAILGVVFNGVAYLRVHQGHSLNERMISLHLMEDVLGWIAVAIGGVVMLVTDIQWIDPFLSLAIVIYILFNVLRNLVKATKIILQATPDNISVKDVKWHLEQIPGVHGAHHIHLWSLDGTYHLLSAHIVVAEGMTINALSPLRKRIHEKMAHKFQVNHITIEFEVSDDCSQNDDL